MNQKGTYGTQGTAATTNVPGARTNAISWTDSAGNLWLFGGFGYDSAGTCASLNDLWKYSAGEWTWTGGANVAKQQGTYGTQGTAATTNIPGAREYAMSWTDSTGNLWVFGGLGYDSAGTFGGLNDLWKYSAGEWTWESGGNVVNQQGTYGTLGTAATTNVPGARRLAGSWTDSAGNFWLFGGVGFDSAGNDAGLLNDLWKYSSGEWTWESGSNVVNQLGTYGTLGTAATSNVPGARCCALTWTDSAGSLWLFGGGGYGSAGNQGDLNDLWKYSAGEWIWVNGGNVVNQLGTYGTLGTAALANVPGARLYAVSWTDSAGNFWLLGGYGFDSAGNSGYLNDLWKYEP
ncbi:MAG: kelch repeat-containing protein [Candidatus Sulfotelmatobacter sp.]